MRALLSMNMHELVRARGSQRYKFKLDFGKDLCLKDLKGSTGMKIQAVAVGEILVDFISKAPGTYYEARAFERHFGGAPMNTIVGVARLGVSAGAVAAVGDDPFGQFLMGELERNRVDVSQMKVKKGVPTTISFVANAPISGERAFIFYRKPWVNQTSDSALTSEDVNPEYISSARILHVSGFALSQSPCREAVFKALRIARKAGVTVSFDPTLRVEVWDSERVLRKTYSQVLKLCDIVSFSEEEAQYLFGTSDIDEVSRRVSIRGIEVIALKLGAKGCVIVGSDKRKVEVPAFTVKAVDTTGAGDGWNAGLLTGLCQDWDLEKCALVANAVGALVVTKRGATTAMPHTKELKNFLREQGYSRLGF